MIKRLKIQMFTVAFTALFLVSSSALAANSNIDSCLKIQKWSVYATWSAVAILNNVEIENSCETGFRNIKVKINYSSSSSPGNTVSQETGILPIVVPPMSNNTYLKNGIPFGAASQFMNPLDIKIVSGVAN